MTMSAAEYDARFGTAWHTNGDKIKEAVTYVTYAGNPTNNVTPAYIGQECLDTANSDWYRSTGTAAANWKKLTP